VRRCRFAAASLVAVAAVAGCATSPSADARGGLRAADARPPSGRSHALVIGINRYDAAHWRPLTYAVADASAVADRLDAAGFDVITLLDEEATGRAIVSALEDTIAAKVAPGDRVMVFFAGHGHTHRFDRVDYGYLVPADGDKTRGSLISMETLQAISRKLGAARHQLFIMDSCFGGLFAPRGEGITADRPDYLEQLAARQSRWIITAGGPDETVADGGAAGHSLFTAALLGALDGGDANGDKVITVTEIYDAILQGVSGRGQTPLLATLPGSQGGQFLFETAGGPKVFARGAAEAKVSPRRSAPPPRAYQRRYFQGFDEEPGKGQKMVDGTWHLGVRGDWKGELKDHAYKLCNAARDKTSSYTNRLEHRVGAVKTDLSDARVVVTVTVQPPSATYSGGGILFRASEDTDRYLAFVLNAGPAVSLIHRVGDSVKVVWSADIALPPGSTVKLAVEGHGDEIRFFVADQRVHTLTKFPDRHGDVGLMAYSMGCFVFDDLMVSALSGEDEETNFLPVPKDAALTPLGIAFSAIQADFEAYKQMPVTRTSLQAKAQRAQELACYHKCTTPGRYMAIVEKRDPTWSVAALVRMGEVHAALAEGIRTTPIPAGADEMLVQGELDNFAFGPQETAIELYDRAVALARELGVTNEWSAFAKVQLEDLRR
jgi:uncharacterized caspase-like protein